MYYIYFQCLGKYSFRTIIGNVLRRLVLGPKPRHLQLKMPMLTLAMMMRMEMLCATYLLMERTTIGFRGWTNLLGRGALLDAPEDRGPGPLLQWAGGGLHGGADGSKQVLTGGDQGISLVLEIEDPFFLNVPRCGPGVSRDDISWTRAISWKTTNDAPSNLSLAIAVCSWPELIPAIETGNRSTMICITCRYKVSIRTQVLQVRVSTKFVNPYRTKPTPRRVCWTSIKKLSRRQILLDVKIPRRKKYKKTRPVVEGMKVKKFSDWARRTTRSLSCWRLRRPRSRSSLTKTWTAGIYCKINYLLCNIFIFNV